MIFAATSISRQIDRTNGTRISRPSAASTSQQRRTAVLLNSRAPRRPASPRSTTLAADQVGMRILAFFRHGPLRFRHQNIGAAHGSASEIESIPANLNTGRPS